jgi:hypothetical protein
VVHLRLPPPRPLQSLVVLRLPVRQRPARVCSAPHTRISPTVCCLTYCFNVTAVGVQALRNTTFSMRDEPWPLLWIQMR